MHEIEEFFPELSVTRYEITSPCDANYNCIAWAAGDLENWWWPIPIAMYYWPSGIAREETLDAFRLAFESRGYQVCDDGGLEDGFEKVAIYTNDAGMPRHAARQLQNGTWTSKCGEYWDISHELRGLHSKLYGREVLFMSRPFESNK